MEIQDLINSNKQKFLQICESANVAQLYAFGSSVSTEFNENSDIDLIIHINDLDPISKGEKLLSIWDKFEDFFKRKVDLLTESSIKNPILRKNIAKTKVLLYEK